MQMTRENKLALVVGFALILFVGILISDHFSTARNQASANLAENRPIDPTLVSRRHDANLLDHREPVSQRGGERPAGTPARNPADVRPLEHQSQPEPQVSPRHEPEVITMGGHAFVSVSNPTPANPPFLFHDVKAGESLTSICRRYYDDGSLVKKLAEFNDLSDPDTLRAGHRLRIPAAETLTGGQGPVGSSPAPPPPPKPQTEPPAPKTYTVKPGDTLSEIAQRQLGTSRRWKEIVELNREAIRDESNLHVGTVLKLPAP